MFPGEEDPGGYDDELEDRALFVPARGGGGGGADRDGDGDEVEERQPGCIGFFNSWRRRRSRITATTGEMVVKGIPPRELSAELPGQRQARTDLPPQEVCAETSQQLRARTDLPPQEVCAETPRQQRARTHTTTGDIATQAKELTELPTDVDYLIVAKIPSLSDRCSLQSVSRRWRSATQQCVCPPLPLVANAEFTMSNCFAEGPRSVPLPMNSNIPRPLGHEVTCLGSLDSWMVVAYDEWDPQGNLALPHIDCFIVQPVKGRSHALPSPCSSDIESASGSIEIIDGNGRFTFYQPSKTSSLRLKKVVMSQSANPADSKVMGLATQRGRQHVVFSTPAMSSWYICSAAFITVGSDLELLDDKLIILGNNQEEIFQIDFGPDLSFFPVVCEVKRCMIMDLPQLENTHQQLNLVRSGSDLWLVARHFTLNWEQLTAVRVFQLDSLNWTWRQIHDIGEHCILVSLTCSRAIYAPGAGQNGPKAGHIYFLDQFCPNFFPAEGENFSNRSQVYDLIDGTVNEHLIGSGQGIRRPGFPMWFFPSD